MKYSKKKSKIILDLCGGTGAWSEPYCKAGYDVRLVDLPTDVRLLKLPTEKIHGILAAPPCTKFCRMRMCHGRPSDNEFREGLSVVDACLRIIQMCNPDWWALENPQGYLRLWLGEPLLKFDPWYYGDPWTKRTWIWGRFNPHLKRNNIEYKGSLIKDHYSQTGRLKQGGIAKTAREASRTPSGFANAFFRANP